MTPHYLNDKDPWLLGENIPDSDIFFFQIVFSSFTNDRSYSFIKKYKKVIAPYDKFNMSFYFGERDSYLVAESVLRALIERPKFATELNRNIVAWSKKLMLFARRVARKPLHKFSNTALWRLYDEHDRVHTKLYTYGWLPVSVDMFHNNMTTELKRRLAKVCTSSQEVNEAFVLLTTPSQKTIIAKEREEFLAIYTKAKPYLRKSVTAVAFPLSLQRLCRRHQQRWGHLGYIYAGNVEPFSVQYYIQEMVDLKRSNIEVSSLLIKEKSQLLEAVRKQKAFYKKNKMSPEDVRLFAAARDFSISKLFRRHAQLLDLYLLHKSLLSEIAQRLSLTRFQVQFMLKDEIKAALINGKVDDSLLSERLKQGVYYTEPGLETVYTGRKARVLAKALASVGIGEGDEVTGQTAQPGYAKGVVKIIIRAKDIAKMNKGDILVSIATDPDIVPAMKKAGAIVTDQGGITSHAAIVSRELNKPCVIGTKYGSKIFKDGDIVEVDATNGIVRKVT
ncbi:MAG: PEP-utilizing enzyme [Patescibacteria group bacterium]